MTLRSVLALDLTLTSMRAVEAEPAVAPELMFGGNPEPGPECGATPDPVGAGSTSGGDSSSMSAPSAAPPGLLLLLRLPLLTRGGIARLSG